LRAYYTEHSSDFNLKKRATIRKITADTDKQAKAIYKLLSSKPKISDDSLMVEMKKIGIVQPKISIQVADETKTKLNINAQSLSLPKLSGNKYELTQVYNLQGAKARSFEECRGYVVAAYQEYLEKKWLAELRLKYPVVINKDVFETLVKK
jgi:peptidyl-prolyl cis-trans isomerase SurA